MKNRILNDPVYGFIGVLEGELATIFEHPFFQRLRRIKQLGLTYYVYPGALHTRFHHTLGATHLMGLAISILKQKGVDITPPEELAAKQAILLHDIGHGPFSHALEHTIINVSHEDISLKVMDYLLQKGIDLSLAIDIFKGDYSKKFLHDLISSSLDVDRLDYLKRDSFFTGVSEGVIGTERIIKMLNVFNNNLVVEYKGLHSVENFLIARELMYWQVYLHKTVTVAEQMLIMILSRAKYLAKSGKNLFATPPFKFFLYNEISENDFNLLVEIKGRKLSVLELFLLLDDDDIMSAIKVWSLGDDKILSDLSMRLLNRNLFKIRIQEKPFTAHYIEIVKSLLNNKLGLSEINLNYYYKTGKVVLPKAKDGEEIKILKDNLILPLSEATEILNINMFSKNTEKYYMIYPKEIISLM